MFSFSLFPMLGTVTDLFIILVTESLDKRGWHANSLLDNGAEFHRQDCVLVLHTNALAKFIYYIYAPKRANELLFKIMDTLFNRDN